MRVRRRRTGALVAAKAWSGATPTGFDRPCRSGRTATTTCGKTPRQRAHHIKTLYGHRRHDQLVALRSLFTRAKRAGRAFRNRAGRIRVGRPGAGGGAPELFENLADLVVGDGRQVPALAGLGTILPSAVS